MSFLQDLEESRKISARSRNLRLTAIRSFFRYAAFEAPDRSAQIQRVLAIQGKRHVKPIISFLTREEVKAMLAATNQETWLGRRDHALMLLAVHTGLRVSELIQLKVKDVVFGPDTAHLRVLGKGRKERSTPLSKHTLSVLKPWMKELPSNDEQPLFPSSQGHRLSPDAIECLIAKHKASASKGCPSLTKKRITPHSLRHTLAMELLLSGIDRTMIALWLGHESIETTEVYLQASLELKEKILEKTQLPEGKLGRFEPDDSLLEFLTTL